MNAKFALVRPSYVSDTDPLAALYITRLSIRIATAATCINDSIFADDIRKLIGIEPLEGTIPKTELRILLRARLPEVEHAASESDSGAPRKTSPRPALVKLPRSESVSRRHR